MLQIDLITMLSNLSRSLSSVQALLTGFGYLLGLLLIITALYKFKLAINHSSRTEMGVPVLYLLAGSGLMYMPTLLDSLTKTLFGSNTILQYTHYEPVSVYSSMSILIQTAGIIWFVRGAILITHASQPGNDRQQSGLRSLMFLLAGILAMNLNETMSMLETIMNYIMTIFK